MLYDKDFHDSNRYRSKSVVVVILSPLSGYTAGLGAGLGAVLVV